MKNLIIVGNGFDLVHGLNTNYLDFKEYLIENQEKVFLDSIGKYIDSDMLWNEFENALGEIDEDQLLGVASDYLIYPWDDEWRDRDNHVYQQVMDGELSFANQIQRYLIEWIRSITIDCEPKLKHIVNNSSQFLTFNYTTTLEDVYEIKPENIIHIHGTADDEDLVVGHSLIRKKKEYDMYEDIRLIEGDEILHSYYESTFKDTNAIISKYRKQFDKWTTINFDNVIVLGHSVSLVDLDYYRELGRIKKRWTIVYYKESEKDKIQSNLIKAGIQENYIKMTTWEQVLFRNHRRKPKP